MAADEHPAAARWARLVGARLAELERLAPERGALSGEFWDRRAERRPAAARTAPDAPDALLRRLLRVTRPGATLVDVGAGSGRHALGLAAAGRRVTAVDPSAAMLAALERDARALGLGGAVATVRAPWHEATVAACDVAYSSFVMTLVPDARAFVAKLEASARERVVLYLGTYAADALLDPIWRHFHGAPRAPGASYLDAIAVLHELGIEPRVALVELPSRRRFATVEEAVDEYLEWLLVPDEPAVRDELAGLLAHWLLGRAGALRSPLRSSPAAIIEWRPERVAAAARH